MLAMAGIFAAGFPSYGQSLQQLRTENCNLIYYSRAHAYVVPHLVRCYENALGYYKQFFNYSIRTPMTIFLQDFSDYGNGGATAVPQNIVLISIAPFNHAYDVMAGNDRVAWLMNHELVHVIVMDKATRRDRFFRSLFRGKVLPSVENPVTILYSALTNPRTYSPRWYHEGIAVFMETWTSGGLGRALGSYDEMVFRTKILENARLYEAVGLEAEGTAIDFQVGAMSYMYGTRFFSYMANRFGPLKVIEWIDRREGTRPTYAGQFRQSFGVPLDREWANWIRWERTWQQANLDSVRKNPLTWFRPITRKTVLGSVSRAFIDTTSGRMFMAVRYPGQVAHIAAVDMATGKMKKIVDIKGAALYYVCSLAHDPDSGTLFYTTDNNRWRDLNALDLRTGRARKLIGDARTGDLAFDRSTRCLWGVRQENGICTVVKIGPPYRDWTALHAFPYGTDVYDIDVSPDGKWLTAALSFVDGKQHLVKMKTADLEGDRGTYDVLFDFDVSSPSNFVFSADGRFLFGSSYYTGVSNIYRYDLDKSDMSILSNCETGLFKPVPVSADSLIAFRYTGEGFVPGWIPNRPVDKVGAIRFLGQEVATRHPEVKTWLPGSPMSVRLDSLQKFRGPYRSARSIRLASVIPIVEGYKDRAAVGVRLNFDNELMFHGFDIRASYIPDGSIPPDERFHIGFGYHYWQWKLSAAMNEAGFYDLFGPTRISRKGYSASLDYARNLIYDDPRLLDLSVKLAGYSGLERLPEYQNVATSADRFAVLQAALKYNHVDKSLGAVDEETGIRCHLTARATLVNGSAVPQAFMNLAYGFQLPINHSSIWFRSAFGASPGDPEDPFANFYFGGFGNNTVDYQTEKRYREHYSFPGVPLNFVGGTRFAKGMTEWSLPPVRFRRFGFPSLYCNWMRTALFSSMLSTEFGRPDLRRSLANAGLQVDFRIVVFSHFDCTASFGYAAAAEKRRRPSHEWMASLKIM